MKYESIKKYLVKFWYAILYFVFANINLLRLRAFNKELNSQNFSSAFDLLNYQNSLPMRYLVWAFIFLMLGCFICGYCIRQIVKNVWRNHTEIISYMVVLLVIMIEVLMILYFITNPILTAVVTVAIIGAIMVWLVTPKKYQ